MNVEKITKYRTSDGVEHSSKEMAGHYILNARLRDKVADTIGIVMCADERASAAQDVLNSLSGNAALVREWLDSCDAMLKAAEGK